MFVVGSRQPQAQSTVEGFASHGRALPQFGADGRVNALPHAWGRQHYGGPHVADILRQLQQAFREGYWRTLAQGQHFHHDALRNVRGGQERHSGIVGSDRPSGGRHVHVRDDGCVRNQSHLRLAGGPGSQIEDRVVGGRDFSLQAGHILGVLGQRQASAFAQLVERQGALGLARKQDARHVRRSAQRVQDFRILHEQGLRAATLNGADDVLGRVTGIKRGRHAAGGQDAQICDVELQAGLRIERHHVAFADADRAQARGDFLRGRLVLIPRVSQILALPVFPSGGLPQGRGVAKLRRGFFEDLIYGARMHSATMLSDRGVLW